MAGVDVLGDRQLDVEPFRDDVGDGLAAERGVQHVGRDLRVEADGERHGTGSRREPRGQDRLHVMADEALAARHDEVEETGDGLGRVGDDGPPVLAGHGEGERIPAERPRIGGDERDPEVRLGRDPVRDRRVDPLDGPDLEPSRVVDGGRERRGQVALGHLDERPILERGGATAADRIEVEAELEAVTARRPGAAAPADARRAPAPPRRCRRPRRDARLPPRAPRRGAAAGGR